MHYAHHLGITTARLLYRGCAPHSGELREGYRMVAQVVGSTRRHRGDHFWACGPADDVLDAREGKPGNSAHRLSYLPRYDARDTCGALDILPARRPDRLGQLSSRFRVAGVAVVVLPASLD